MTKVIGHEVGEHIIGKHEHEQQHSQFGMDLRGSNTSPEATQMGEVYCMSGQKKPEEVQNRTKRREA